MWLRRSGGRGSDDLNMDAEDEYDEEDPRQLFGVRGPERDGKDVELREVKLLNLNTLFFFIQHKPNIKVGLF